MIIPIRIVIVAVIMALFCAWIDFVYVGGRKADGILAVGYSLFVMANLVVIVFWEEISRLFK